MAAALRPPPRDLRQRQAYRQGPELDDIVRSIREGVGTGSGGMPAYAHLSEEDLRLLATYIVSLQEDSP
jgi:mono/diheme cytochrome c family protein